MSNINAMFDAINALPGRGTPEEARKAARVLAAIGRRVGADDWETADVIASLGLDQEPDTRRHVDLMKPGFNPSTRVRVHVESRGKA